MPGLYIVQYTKNFVGRFLGLYLCDGVNIVGCARTCRPGRTLPKRAYANDGPGFSLQIAECTGNGCCGLAEVGSQRNKDAIHSRILSEISVAFYPDERIALFIDGANFHSCGKALEFDIDYRKLLDLFKTKGRLQRASYYTALRENDDYSPLRPLIDWLDYNGFTVITKPAKSFVDREGRHRTKGNMDIEIAIDVLNMADHLDHVVLFSGDGDFAALCCELRRRGVRTTVVSTMESKPPMLADELRRAADAVIDLADMETMIGRPRREYVPRDTDDGYDDD